MPRLWDVAIGIMGSRCVWWNAGKNLVEAAGKGAVDLTQETGHSLRMLCKRRNTHPFLDTLAKWESLVDRARPLTCMARCGEFSPGRLVRRRYQCQQGKHRHYRQLIYLSAGISTAVKQCHHVTRTKVTYGVDIFMRQTIAV